ncbi:MAG: ATP-binding protein [Acidobacteriota bacterium]
MRTARPVEISLLIAAAAAPFLPAGWPALVLVAIGAAFLAQRPAPREGTLVGACLLAAAVILGGAWLLSAFPAMSPEEWTAAAQRPYRELWAGLRQEAAEASASIAHAPETPDQRLAAFRILAERADAGRPGLTLALINPDGEAVAWAGAGLLHELSGNALPLTGDAFVAGFSSATLVVVRPLAGEKRPFRVAAGVSLPVDRLPFKDPSWRRPRAWRWSLVDSGDQGEAAETLPQRWLALDSPGDPRLIAEPGDELPQTLARPRRAAWIVLGLGLFGLAVLRGIGLAFLSGTVVRSRARPWQVVALGAGGVSCWLLAAAAPPSALLPLLVAGLVGIVASKVRWQRRARWSAAGGALAAMLLLSLCFLAGRLGFSIDLGSALWGSSRDSALRLGLASFAFALLLLAGGRRARHPAEVPARSRLAWLAIGSLLTAGALLDFEILAGALLVLGFALAAVWAAGNWPTHRLAAGATAVLIAALSSAVAWELASRAALRDSAPQLLQALAPPSDSEQKALEVAVQRALAETDIEDLSPSPSLRLDRQDLAIALWRRSPLGRANIFSALSVIPYGKEGSRFAFGLPLRGGARVEQLPGRWSPPRLPVWDDTLVSGEVELKAGGKPYGRGLYWFQPRPGFRWGMQRAGDLGLDLLRGAPGAHTVEGLPAGVTFALYDPTGHALLAPWRETPPLDPRLRRGVVNEVATPVGTASAWAAAGREGWRAIYIPRLAPLAGLDRVGTHCLASLLLAAAASLLVVLLGLPRATFRDTLRRAVRSYSKRLLIVYTVLLLVPLLLLSVALVGGLEERVRNEQRSDGQQALASAQRVLGEYLLTLDPGFGLDTTLDDDLLLWLSAVVHHEVNLYWGSTVYASSKRELFTAGLLPKRIPGDIYSRLALQGYDVASKTGHTGEVSYLEIYAPLRMPDGNNGTRDAAEGLTLSMPLLAQQEETQTAIAYLHRQALLGASALFILLVAVGGRLAQNFTRPLQELVQGTQRIAAGASSLGLAPTELELAALVEAVDRMARRIAEAREDLVRGKHVLENMVENVTAGVVSLDREQRAILHNRVAAELLGVSAGEALATSLAKRPGLAPVAEWLRGISRGSVKPGGTEPQRTAMKLRTPEGEREWTLVWVQVPGAGEPSALFVVEDATEILRGQRLEAWAEMARMIAHEIKNPLTPIRLSAEHMREVYASAPERFAEVFERCTTNILGQVEDLRQIASEFSTYSRIPKLALADGDLVPAVRRIVEGYQAAPPPGVEIELQESTPHLLSRFDERMLGRAVRNLLENAVRASAGQGTVRITVERVGDQARVVVADRGPGVPAELLPRIFDPYFSTHDTGTGLGLPIARRIVEEHGGGVAAYNGPGGGLEVVITIPCL